MRKIVSFILIALLTLYFIINAAVIWTHPKLYQWDFDIYYHSAQSNASGINPYNSQISDGFTQQSKNLGYVYPPITLLLFRIFLCFDYATAFHLFLVIKVILLIGLLYIWKYHFLKNEFGFLFILFCTFGFNAALLADLAAGNISIIEQFILWSAFYSFLRKKLLIFGLLIVLVAIFKIVPMIFLLLMLISENKNKYLYIFAFIGLFVFVMASSYIMTPELFIGFINNSMAFNEVGIINPSNYALVSHLFKIPGQMSGLMTPAWISLIIYFGIVGIVLTLSWRAYQRILLNGMLNSEMILLFLACLVYALIMPRFKDYSYLLLLVPTYYIIMKIGKMKAFPFVLGITMLSSVRHFELPGLDLFFKAFWNYYPLILTYLIWILYLYYIYRPDRTIMDSIIKNDI